MAANTFVATHYRTLDTKGRLILPPAYREAIASHTQEGAEIGFWLTGFYGRLVAYMPKDWDVVFQQLNKIPFTNIKLSHFKSKVIGLASFLSPDSQGRIRIPQPLLREAKLEKDIVLVGMQDKFEIWDQASFDAILTNEDMSEAIASTGLELSL
ncbi:MAG: division/cell wall cluster transcriptional repressor MraZ [Desulfovibrio sp.]|nr:division/cell wall cluster transcriptional repressor MraZ [Desulfovibrio sp.]